METDGRVEVSFTNGIIIAKYMGTMHRKLLEEANARILALADQAQGICYNTLEMNDPTMALAMQMRQFDRIVSQKVGKCATVTNSANTAFLAKLAFVFTPHHRIFFRDLPEALLWLRS